MKTGLAMSHFILWKEIANFSKTTANLPDKNMAHLNAG
jgi:hypothetical protein